jgi:hypothetical protein
MAKAPQLGIQSQPRTRAHGRHQPHSLLRRNPSQRRLYEARREGVEAAAGVCILGGGGQVVQRHRAVDQLAGLAHTPG